MVAPAVGGTAIRDWESLDDQHKAKLVQRFTLLCTADSMLDHTKVRAIKGGPQGIFEIKIRNPPYRAFAFREGKQDWRVTHIDMKPSKSRLLQEAEKADRIRRVHQATSS